MVSRASGLNIVISGYYLDLHPAGMDEISMAQIAEEITGRFLREPQIPESNRA